MTITLKKSPEIIETEGNLKIVVKIKEVDEWSEIPYIIFNKRYSR